jgi:5-methylcytosine-specific restriction enzyme A
MTGFDPATRNVILGRAGFVGPWVCCERCGDWNATVQCHHRRPRGMGGSRAADTNLASN